MDVELPSQRKQIRASRTSNAGKKWTTPELISLPNPNAAIAVLNTGDGNLLLAYNDLEDGRNRLSLATRSMESREFGWISAAIVSRNYFGL